jgi:ribokinase
VFAARLAAGDSLLEAAVLGTAAGSLAVRTPGAQKYDIDLETLRATAATATAATASV